MDGAQHIPEIAYLRRVISSVQIRRPPSLVPNPSPRLGFRARHRLHCRRGSGVPGGSSSSSTVPPRHEIDTLGGFLFEWWSIFDARTREKPREGGAASSVDVTSSSYITSCILVYNMLALQWMPYGQTGFLYKSPSRTGNKS